MAKKKTKKVRMRIPKMAYLSPADISLLTKAVAYSRYLNQLQKQHLLDFLKKMKD